MIKCPFKEGDIIESISSPYRGELAVVTEITERGFKFDFEKPVWFIPRSGMSFTSGEEFLDIPGNENPLDRWRLIQPVMTRWNDELPHDQQQYVTITSISVPTEYDKTELLKAIEYLHNRDIDTDYHAVNSLVHMYQYPERIIVEQKI